MATQYRFGAFKLLPAERRLFRRGSEVALTARAFEVLVAFAERAGQLLSKDDLLKRVWAGLVVEENNLAVQVAVLRKVLGAQAITTVPGHGYRFALDVIEVTGVGPDHSGPRGQGNLPVRLPSLIGREAELARAVALLRSHPMLTLCGGPGFGKTRLAQELALQLRDRYADGAWWIDLTLLRENESVALAVARTLGMSLSPDTEPLAVLTRRLAATATLIVLDNAEHCAEAVSQVAEALARDTARNSIIVTSQVPLHAAGERLLRLAPLPLHDAVRLLAERAAGSDWDAEDAEQAATICRELDGNPLAIELAAARVDALGVGGLAARLNQRLTLLAPGDAVRPSRRNALATALDWSHELLGTRERLVLRRLAVFPGSFSLEAAALVLASDEFPAPRAVEAVLSLVDRSLISAERGAQLRYRLLETTRLFALGKLDAAGETASAQARLCAGMRWLFDDAYEESWHTPPPQWRTRYEPELVGLWATLSWATEHDVESAAALFGASSPLWNLLSQQALLAKVHAMALAERVTDAVPAPTRARFWLACAHCHTADHPGQARAAAERAARLYRELGDARGEYLALVEYAFNWRVDGAEARAALASAKAIEHSGWPPTVIERGLTAEAVLHLTTGRFDAARQCYLAALQVCQRVDHQAGVNSTLTNLADLERAAGHVDEAIRLGENLRERMRDDEPCRNLATMLGNLLGALVEQNRYDEAREVALEFRRRLGRLTLDASAWTSLDALALLHLHDGSAAIAARLAGAADREHELHGQAQRQPNEAADRAKLDALLALQLPAAERTRLHAEGQRMSTMESIDLAFDLDHPATVGSRSTPQLATRA